MKRTACLLMSCCLVAAAYAGEKSYRLAWKLPERSVLEYEVTAAGEGKGRMAMTATLSFNISIRAPKPGLALVDTSLAKASMKVGGKKFTPPGAAQAFHIRTLLREGVGVDPYASLPTSQRNVFKMLFPIPGRSVRLGEKWPVEVQLMMLGTLGQAKEDSWAVLSEVRKKDGSALAIIDIQSMADAGVTEPTPRGKPAASMSIQGSAVFDVSKGRLVSNDLRAAMRTELGDRPDQKMELTVTVKLRLVKAGTMPKAEAQRLTRVLHVRETLCKCTQLAQKGQLKEALEAVAKVVDSEFHSEHAPLVAAQIYLRAGRLAEAEKAIERALAHHPDHLQSLMLAAQIYQRLGKADRAREVQEKIRRLITGAKEQPEH